MASTVRAVLIVMTTAKTEVGDPPGGHTQLAAADQEICQQQPHVVHRSREKMSTAGKGASRSPRHRAGAGRGSWLEERRYKGDRGHELEAG